MKTRHNSKFYCNLLLGLHTCRTVFPYSQITHQSIGGPVSEILRMGNIVPENK